MSAIRHLARPLALAAGMALLAVGPAAAQNTLKIGVLGVMSGPAASWGLVNKYSAEATAEMYNAQGGVEIDGEKYIIEVVSIDDKNDPKLAASGAERLVHQEGIKYIIGPNVDITAASIVPVIEAGGAMSFPYSFTRQLYSPPNENMVLGMVASYQAGPIIYKYLMENEGVQSIAFIALNSPDALHQRDDGVAAATEFGIEILSSEDTYEPGTTDFFPVVSKVVGQDPDLIVLSGATPADAPLLIRSARELGYEGLLSAETAHDINILNEVAGEYADGFISVGGASTPEIRSAYMEEFVEHYNKIAGEWNDEAGTKSYALEMILMTLQQAGKEALEDVELFKAAIPEFSAKNPFLKEDSELKYVGEAYFEQPRQIGVPMVVNEVRDGEFKTLFIGSVE